MMIWHDREAKHYKPVLSEGYLESISEHDNGVQEDTNLVPLIENQSSDKYISLIRRRRKKQNRPMPNLNNNELEAEILDELDELIFGETNNHDVSLARLNLGINESLNNGLVIHRYNTRLNQRLVANEINYDENAVANNLWIAPAAPVNWNHDTALEQIQIPIERLNDKGKPMSECEFCHNWYERKTGLRIHQISCRMNQLLNVGTNEDGNNVIPAPVENERMIYENENQIIHDNIQIINNETFLTDIPGTGVQILNVTSESDILEISNIEEQNLNVAVESSLVQHARLESENNVAGNYFCPQQ